jgi:murein DD-endopeptidase MepM/ murein hydrolase activator NlpD
MAPPTPLPQYQTQAAEKPGWSAQGGQRVTVQAGDTAYGLGMRYGVPASTILQANNLPPGAQLNAGQSIVIPGYRGPAQVQPNPPVKTAKPKPAPASSGNVHTVRSGDTLYSIAREYDVSPRELADANNIGLDYRVRQGESISLPNGHRTVARAEAPAPRVQQPVYKPEENAGTNRAFENAQPPKTQPAVARATETPREVAGGTDFRWPVRGRVISGFGQKPNGQSNDGVNISVPEGTEIKAAEGGVVAYAGNQLKGFGNLVLIRHQGEWVTAYAHASEILVKRGDTVRRGQVIARSGRTGNVTSPQLHFEVRRGASPVDPLSHLPNV